MDWAKVYRVLLDTVYEYQDIGFRLITFIIPLYYWYRKPRRKSLAIIFALIFGPGSQLYHNPWIDGWWWAFVFTAFSMSLNDWGLGNLIGYIVDSIVNLGIILFRMQTSKEE